VFCDPLLSDLKDHSKSKPTQVKANANKQAQAKATSSTSTSKSKSWSKRERAGAKTKAQTSRSKSKSKGAQAQTKARGTSKHIIKSKHISKTRGHRQRHKRPSTKNMPIKQPIQENIKVHVSK
jgi:hypothetical protein